MCALQSSRWGNVNRDFSIHATADHEKELWYDWKSARFAHGMHELEEVDHADLRINVTCREATNENCIWVLREG